MQATTRRKRLEEYHNPKEQTKKATASKKNDQSLTNYKVTPKDRQADKQTQLPYPSHVTRALDIISKTVFSNPFNIDPLTVTT